MKKESEDVITELMGVEPIMINSALVSAQNRKRLYWTNIPNVVQPNDKGILLKDILESGVVDREKSYCIDANYYKGTNLQQYLTKCRRQLVFIIPHGYNKGGITLKDKYNTLRACSVYNEFIMLDQYNYRKLLPIECERLQTVPENYTLPVSNTQRYKMLGNGWTIDVILHIFKNMVL